MDMTLDTFVREQVGKGAEGALEKLAAYAALLRQWTPKINLVAPSTVGDLERRHLLDSAQLLPYLPAKPARVVDCGSGAGLPGMVLAILAPQHTFTLAERDQRKAAFLVTARHALGLKNVTVHDGDVGKLPHGAFDVVTARAWANMADIVAQTRPLIVPTGMWLLLKGEAVSQEMEGLHGLRVEMHPSMVLSEGKVVRMEAEVVL